MNKQITRLIIPGLLIFAGKQPMRINAKNVSCATQQIYKHHQMHTTNLRQHRSTFYRLRYIWCTIVGNKNF